MRRKVALKRPRLGNHQQRSLLERFYTEAYAVARLDHPNICPAYDIGEYEGIPYITMAYIDGKPLSEVVRKRKELNSRAIAVLIRKVAAALHEAHQRGIVHRDLKPSNIMLNHRSEPVVMDFGLARQLVVGDDEDPLTRQGMLVGTPSYMSPEQIEGDPDKVGPSSDIYSLGVVFFELPTGQRPFQGSVAAMIGKILRDEPPAPSTLRPGLEWRLDEICLTMLEKLPEVRYESMKQVADALGDFIRGTGATVGESAAVSTPSFASQQQYISQLVAAGRSRIECVVGIARPIN